MKGAFARNGIPAAELRHNFRGNDSDIVGRTVSRVDGSIYKGRGWSDRTLPEGRQIFGAVPLADLPGLRIVILISVFARGGAERQAYLLARELRQRYGLNAEVWALLYEGDYQQDFEAAGIPTRVLGFRWPQHLSHWARRLPRVYNQLKQGGIDILLPFTTWPNVVAGLTYRLCGIPLCIWGERHAGGERIPGFERAALTQYRQFVANSTAGVEFLADEMGIARERISFIPNGVEEPRVEPDTDWRARLNLHPGQPLVVKVANITSQKDHATLLRAWKTVQDAWPDEAKPVLALAGIHGDRYQECERIVSENGLGSTVRFLGSLPDVSALIQASDLAAFSSRKEGMPNGVLECMAFGKAVVSTDLPGVRDVLGPIAADAIVPPGDASQMARRLLDVMRDENRRDAMGEANRTRVRAEFSVQRMADRHFAIIAANASRAKLKAGSSG